MLAQVAVCQCLVQASSAHPIFRVTLVILALLPLRRLRVPLTRQRCSRLLQLPMMFQTRQVMMQLPEQLIPALRQTMMMWLLRKPLWLVMRMAMSQPVECSLWLQAPVTKPTTVKQRVQLLLVERVGPLQTQYALLVLLQMLSRRTMRPAMQPRQQRLTLLQLLPMKQATQLQLLQLCAPLLRMQRELRERLAR